MEAHIVDSYESFVARLLCNASCTCLHFTLERFGSGLPAWKSPGVLTKKDVDAHLVCVAQLLSS